MIFLIFIVQFCFAQEGIWKSICTQSSDCLSYLVCTDGMCTPPNTPTAEQCQSLSFAHKDNRGKNLSVCPPNCGYEEDIVFGPRCIINLQGCLLGKDCRAKGLCGFNGKSCVMTEEGCSSAALCSENGKCGFDGKKCVPSYQGCSTSQECLEEGLCSYLPGPKDYEASHGNCVRSKSGCLKSNICLEKGICGFQNGLCVANVQGCANSQLCKIAGKCRFKPFVGCVK